MYRWVLVAKLPCPVCYDVTWYLRVFLYLYIYVQSILTQILFFWNLLLHHSKFAQVNQCVTWPVVSYRSTPMHNYCPVSTSLQQITLWSTTHRNQQSYFVFDSCGSPFHTSCKKKWFEYIMFWILTSDKPNSSLVNHPQWCATSPMFYQGPQVTGCWRPHTDQDPYLDSRLQSYQQKSWKEKHASKIWAEQCKLTVTQTAELGKTNW